MQKNILAGAHHECFEIRLVSITKEWIQNKRQWKIIRSTYIRGQHTLVSVNLNHNNGFSEVLFRIHGILYYQKSYVKRQSFWAAKRHQAFPKRGFFFWTKANRILTHLPWIALQAMDGGDRRMKASLWHSNFD